MKSLVFTMFLAVATGGACIDEVPFTEQNPGTDITPTSDITPGSDITPIPDTTPGTDTTTDPDIIVTAPQVVANPSSIDFGVVPLAQERSSELRIRNIGTSDATITAIALDIPVAGDIWLLRNTDGLSLAPDTNPFALPRTVAPGAELVIVVIHEDLDGLGASTVVRIEVAGLDLPITVPLVTRARVESADCRPDIIELANASFGAVAIAPWGAAYIAGAEGPQGTRFRLAEVDLDDPSLDPVVPVATNEASWMQSDWIAIEGETVSVYEFYPTGNVYTFNYLTRATVAAVPPSPPDSTRLAMRRANVTWSVHVGSGVDDICRSVCLMRTPDGGDPEVFLDDADTTYRLHTNHVFWHRDHVYFMSYNNETPNRWTGIYRRVHLDSGVDEPLVTLDPTASNAWVQVPRIGEDGRLYWIRIAHDGQNGRAAEYAIDAFDPVSGVLTSNLVTGLGAGAAALQIVDAGYFAWVDAVGIRTAPRAGGEPTTVLDSPANGERRGLYAHAANGAIWYTRTTGDSEATFATFGCLWPGATAR